MKFIPNVSSKLLETRPTLHYNTLRIIFDSVIAHIHLRWPKITPESPRALGFPELEFPRKVRAPQGRSLVANASTDRFPETGCRTKAISRGASLPVSGNLPSIRGRNRYAQREKGKRTKSGCRDGQPSGRRRTDVLRRKIEDDVLRDVVTETAKQISL